MLFVILRRLSWPQENKNNTPNNTKKGSWAGARIQLYRILSCIKMYVWVFGMNVPKKDSLTRRSIFTIIRWDMAGWLVSLCWCLGFATRSYNLALKQFRKKNCQCEICSIFHSLFFWHSLGCFPAERIGRNNLPSSKFQCESNFVCCGCCCSCFHLLHGCLCPFYCSTVLSTQKRVQVHTSV